MSTTEQEHIDAAVDPRVERTRAAILDAARDLLMESGPDAVTHGHVATQARVSRTTAYKHYPTRGDLLRATIEHVGRPFPMELTGDIEADLRAFVHDVADDLGNDEHARAFITLMERAQHDPEIAAVRDGLVCDAEDQFRSMVTNAVTAGQLRHDLDVDIAMAGLMGAFFFRRFMANEPVDADYTDRVVTEFLRAHGTR
jgi:AcrR family transcriptional regulator